VIRALVTSARPHQWTKNAFVFVAPLFARRLTDAHDAAAACAAFGAFCLAASGVYLANDVADRERDRAHSVKRNRPIAAGRLSPAVASGAAAVLLAAGVATGFAVTPLLGALVAGYALIQLAYVVKLRSIVLIDVFCIASGFVLRVFAGAAAVRVPVSSWLVLTTIFLALFLALCKRRAEVSELADDRTGHRETLGEYPIAFLDELIGVTTASVVICYSLYTLDARTVHEFGTKNLVFTVPFVLFGVFRYLFLVHRRGRGASPVTDVARDAPLLLTCALWLATTLLVFAM
jgi:4-hydroxybenzoate polyprenyltransferase